MSQTRNRPGPVAQYDTPAWIVTVLGLGLGLLGLAYLLTHPEPLAIWILEGVLVVVSSAIIVYGGYWIATHPLDRADRWIVAGWAIAGAVIADVFVAGYVLSEQFSGGLVTESAQLVLFGALGGSLVALLAVISVQHRYHVPDAAYPGEGWEDVEGSGSSPGTTVRRELSEIVSRIPFSKLLIVIRYRLLEFGAKGTIGRTFVYFLFKYRYSYNRRRLSTRQTVPTMTYVDPTEIQLSTIPRGVFPSTEDEAFVGTLGGMWDRCRTDIEDTPLYRSLEERFENGSRWEETEMYRLARWAIEHGMSAWSGCRSHSELRAYCRSLDALFESMRENGYVERSTDMTKKDAYEATGVDDEVVVVGDYVVPDEARIGRTRRGGYLRLSGGKHRIILSRLLDIEEIPVIVLVEHEKWSSREDDRE